MNKNPNYLPEVFSSSASLMNLSACHYCSRRLAEATENDDETTPCSCRTQQEITAKSMDNRKRLADENHCSEPCAKRFRLNNSNILDSSEKFQKPRISNVKDVSGHNEIIESVVEQNSETDTSTSIYIKKIFKDDDADDGPEVTSQKNPIVITQGAAASQQLSAFETSNTGEMNVDGKNENNSANCIESTTRGETLKKLLLLRLQNYISQQKPKVQNGIVKMINLIDSAYTGIKYGLGTLVGSVCQLTSNTLTNNPNINTVRLGSNYNNRIHFVVDLNTLVDDLEFIKVIIQGDDFMSTRLAIIIPNCVLEELRHLQSHPDAGRRARAHNVKCFLFSNLDFIPNLNIQNIADDHRPLLHIKSNYDRIINACLHLALNVTSVCLITYDRRLMHLARNYNIPVTNRQFLTQH